MDGRGSRFWAPVRIFTIEGGGARMGEVTVQAIRPVKVMNPETRTMVVKRAGELFPIDERAARQLVRMGRVRQMTGKVVEGWRHDAGMDLHTIPIPAGRWERVVACLNVWNDCAALKETVGSWFPYVDHMIAIDGAYATAPAGAGASTDGTIEFLRALDPAKVEVHVRADRPAQIEKRNQYFELARPGDLLLIVDADEVIEGAERLREVPDLDVGWVRVQTPTIYRREYWQPRILRWSPDLRYAGRHHWIYRGEELLATHQYGGMAIHARVPVVLSNHRKEWRSAERLAAKACHAVAQVKQEAPASSVAGSPGRDRAVGAREGLRILQTARYDAGLAVSRFHSAINGTTTHGSIYFVEAEGRPFGVGSQYEIERDGWMMDDVLADADVLHAHLTLQPFANKKAILPRMVVLHHHGSMFRAHPVVHNALAEAMGALVVVSNLSLLPLNEAAKFLPNPVPVMRYRRLRDAFLSTSSVGAAFRIAHSPSKRHLKGTAEFLAACANLRAKGVDVEEVLIEGMDHADGMRIKATCDACFDSFWLGIQCSGIEAAAMGIPVIAGDPEVAARYRVEFGGVPYTYANDQASLEAAIERLATDQEFRAVERSRVTRYVETFHDEAAVAIRYLDLLDERFQWRARGSAEMAAGQR